MGGNRIGNGLMSALCASTFVESGGVVVTLNPFSDNDIAFDPSDASAGLVVERDGEVRRWSNASLASSWANPKNSTVGDAFWVRLTKSTGSDPTAGSAALNTWLLLSSDRSWFWNQTTIGSKTFTGTYAIATDSSGTNIVSSNSVSIDASVE